MHWIEWVLLVLAVLTAAWLVFDGVHALVTGDYVTPKSGDYAGQLGPWSRLVASVGIEPRSTLMKSIHVVLGVAWLCACVAYFLQVSWAWTAMFACAVLGLWYLPFGTALSLVQIVLLLLPAARGGA